ncbi:MAG: hypothetical protein ACFFDF_01190 [Candidatus Odinarchaeota archaeon]
MSEVIICPVCGFSFKPLNSKIQKKKIKCPMCNYEFRDPRVSPFTPKEFEKKF